MVWQAELLEKLRVSEQPGGLVRVDSTGPVPAAVLDSWSELHIRMTVAAGAVGAFFPEVIWLERYGPIFCVEQRVEPDACVTRVVFEDHRRLDLTIVEQHATLDQVRWQQACDIVSADRARHRPGDAFWCTAVRAVVQVVRDDLLAATDLALGLSRDCMALAIRLREEGDRPIGNEWVAHVLAENASLAEPAGILDHILTSATLFEGLQRLAHAAYKSRRRPLDDLVRQARGETPDRGRYRPRSLNR